MGDFFPYRGSLPSPHSLHWNDAPVVAGIDWRAARRPEGAMLSGAGDPLAGSSAFYPTPRRSPRWRSGSRCSSTRSRFGSFRMADRREAMGDESASKAWRS
jgi:hypothetical protein